MSVSHDHPRFSDPDYMPHAIAADPSYYRCDGCRELVTTDQLEGGYCPECRVCCSVCEDWMAGEEEVSINGQRVHAWCAPSEVQ
jgi:hypothetical protein